MAGRRWTLGLALSAVLAGVVALPVWSQPGGDDGPGRPRGPRGEGREFRQRDPEQMRQRFYQQIKEQLQSSDEEWAVIQPRLEKVWELQRQSRGMRGMMMWRGRGEGEGRFGGPPRGREDQGPQADEPPVAARTRELAELLRGQDDPQPDQIRTALDALREARQQQEQELAQARQELRELLSLRQEATLVLMGLLD
ncbi:MAG TPA: hypothetical protein VF184_06900 [Phycisphaeraceae bacterium]